MLRAGAGPSATCLRGHLGSEDSPAHAGPPRRRLGAGRAAAHLPRGATWSGDHGIALTFKIRQERASPHLGGRRSYQDRGAHEGTNFAASRSFPPSSSFRTIRSPRHAARPASPARHLRRLGGELWHPGAAFDGNNVLDAYAATKLAAGDAVWAGTGAARRRDVPMEGTRPTTSARRATPIPPAVRALGEAGSIGTTRILEGGRDHREAARGDRAPLLTAEVEGAAEQALRSRDRMPPARARLQGVYGKWPVARSPSVRG